MRGWSTTLAIAIMAATGGCAGALPLKTAARDVHADRLARREQAMESFDSRRLTAQLQSARERFREGDLAQCRSQLEQLLSSDPRQSEARRLLADVYLVQQQTAAAAEQLQQLLALDEKDDQTHHSLGLLLMAMDRNEEALVHLQRAMELAPSSDLYRSSLAALMAPHPISVTGQFGRTGSPPAKFSSSSAGAR